MITTLRSPNPRTTARSLEAKKHSLHRLKLRSSLQTLVAKQAAAILVVILQPALLVDNHLSLAWKIGLLDILRATNMSSKVVPNDEASVKKMQNDKLYMLTKV